jgi:hypothetical protein
MRRLTDGRELLDQLHSAARARPPHLRRPAEHAAQLIDRYRGLVAARRDLDHRFRTGPQQ